MGLQIITALPIALLFRCNIFVVYLASLITNPVTAVFIYATMFKIGEFITGNYIPIEQIQIILNDFSFSQLNQLGSIALNNYLIGMSLLTLIVTPISYFLVLFYVNRRKYKFRRIK